MSDVSRVSAPVAGRRHQVRGVVRDGAVQPECTVRPAEQFRSMGRALPGGEMPSEFRGGWFVRLGWPSPQRHGTPPEQAFDHRVYTSIVARVSTHACLLWKNAHPGDGGGSFLGPRYLAQG